MRYTTIEDCHFVGAHATCLEAIQVGPTDATTTEAHMDYCVIRRNRFDTWYGAASQFATAIKLGKKGELATDQAHYFTGTTIENNDIFALTDGIVLNIVVDRGDFSVIRGNVIDSAEAANGCAASGITIENEAKVMVVDNRINATDAIVTSSAMRTLANLVSNAGTPAGENPIYSDST
ncbi:hypothetical protein ES703_114410 [subsurface metagenome]